MSNTLKRQALDAGNDEVYNDQKRRKIVCQNSFNHENVASGADQVSSAVADDDSYFNEGFEDITFDQSFSTSLNEMWEENFTEFQDFSGENFEFELGSNALQPDCSVPHDSYCLEDFEDIDEKDLHSLLDKPIYQEPPSSVLRVHNRSPDDRTSRSAEEFDPQLQHSPVPTVSSYTIAGSDQQLLESDVDWSPVLENPVHSPGDNSRPQSANTYGKTARDSQHFKPSPHILAPPSNSVAQIPSHMALRSFKTFFSLKEMVDTKEQMFKNSEKVTFELFAKVLFSVRENFGHKQLFQFGDLLKETKTPLAGALCG